MNGGCIIMMRGCWYKVPSELFNDSCITKADMAVYAYVADRLKGKRAGVSVRSVAAATELSGRQVQLSLHKLVEYGYLNAQPQPGRCTLYQDELLPRDRKGGVKGYEHAVESELRQEVQDKDFLAG